MPKFTVQKHDASRLHYDFRLEMYDDLEKKNHVLKSWAVPKGPSMDTSQKRLAIHVEDHDMSYADFEGEIPEGQYGAGKVIVWDNGEYLPIKKDDDIREIDLEKFYEWYNKGNLEFELKGEKLKGKFALVKMKGKNWLLIKMKDNHTTKKDILKKDKSVISGKTVKEIS